jgi:hypothetical protein
LVALLTWDNEAVSNSQTQQIHETLAARNQHMTNIGRIKTALEFLKDNQGFKVGGLFLSRKDNVVYVSGFTNFNDPKNMNKRIAIRELEDAKAEFNDYIEIVPEFKDFLKNKEIKYILAYDYGMGNIGICSEIKGVITWEYKLAD